MKELLLIFLFQITFSLDTKIISVNYIHNFGKPSIKITLYENRTHYVYLNTFLPYTHLDKDDWPIDKKESTKIDLCHTYESFECESSLSTKNFEISSLLYYIGDNIHFGPDQGLALNYKFNNERYSLIHQLYNENKISHKVFVFETNKDTKNFHFGGIPNQAYLNYTYSGYCNIDNTFPNWGCNVTEISYNNETFKLNSYALFHSAFVGQIYSNSLFELFVKSILKKEIEQRICERESVSEDRDRITCKYSFQDTETFHKNVIIKFGNMEIHYPIEKIFDFDDGIWESRLWTNPYHLYKKYDIIFSSRFIEAFNYAVFDYENNRIEFYSDKITINMLQSSTNKIIKIILVVMLCMLSLNVFVLILNKVMIK